MYHVQHDIAYSLAIVQVEYRSNFELVNDVLYLIFLGLV